MQMSDKAKAVILGVAAIGTIAGYKHNVGVLVNRYENDEISETEMSVELDKAQRDLADDLGDINEELE